MFNEWVYNKFKLVCLAIISYLVYYFVITNNNSKSFLEGFQKADTTNTIANNNNSDSTNYIANKRKPLFHNYNHFTGSSMDFDAGAVYSDALGDTITIKTTSKGIPFMVLKQMQSGATMVLKPSETTTEEISERDELIFYAPIGEVSAKFIYETNTALPAIQLKMGNGEKILFTHQAQLPTFTQWFGSTGNTNPPPLPPLPPSSNYTTYSGPYGGSVETWTGPYSNTAFDATGPRGNSVAGVTSFNNNNNNNNNGPYYGNNTAFDATGVTTAVTSTNTNNNQNTGPYYSQGGADALPAGIPKSQIPPGKEDL